jgi:uncharacterized membrane protein YhaH (DUF805 family)
MGFGDAVRRCLNLYATFEGRARRSEFWWFALFQLLLNMGATAIDAVLLGGLGLLPTLVVLGLFLPTLAVAVRRLHDTGRTGWWVLISLIPLIGVVVLLIFYVSQGEDGTNRFGPDPRRAPPGGPARPWDPDATVVQR